MCCHRIPVHVRAVPPEHCDIDIRLIAVEVRDVAVVGARTGVYVASQKSALSML